MGCVTPAIAFCSFASNHCLKRDGDRFLGGTVVPPKRATSFKKKIPRLLRQMVPMLVACTSAHLHQL